MKGDLPLHIHSHGFNANVQTKQAFSSLCVKTSPLLIG